MQVFATLSGGGNSNLKFENTFSLTLKNKWISLMSKRYYFSSGSYSRQLSTEITFNLSDYLSLATEIRKMKWNMRMNDNMQRKKMEMRDIPKGNYESFVAMSLKKRRYCVEIL